MVWRLVVTFALVLALAPSAAGAAEVSTTGGVLRYVAAAGKRNNLNVEERSAGTITVGRITVDDDAVRAARIDVGPPRESGQDQLLLP